MSISRNVTEKDLISLSDLADQRKNQRAIEIKNRTLKQTQDKKLTENFSNFHLVTRRGYGIY